MKFKKLFIGIVSALCALTCFAGAGISVFADENLSTDITIYVSDNDAMPADGAHTFIIMDGSSESRVQNSGNTATFTVTLPAGQDVKTVIVYEEQSNPAGYVYDQSVYGISLVANFDHTMLDSIDITKDGVEYAGNIFFANTINTAPATPEPAIDPNTGLPVDPNATPAAEQDTEPAAEEGTVYEREHVVYGTAIGMDAQSTIIRDGDGTEHVVYDNNVRIINQFNLNDEIVLAYNGSAEDMKDAIIGKDLKISIVEPAESSEDETEISVDTPEETIKPEATAKAEEETDDLKEPVINEKKSKSNTWLTVVLIAGGIAIAMIIGILIGSKPGKQVEDFNDLDDDISGEELDEEFDDEPLDDNLDSDEESVADKGSEEESGEEDAELDPKDVKFSEIERAEGNSEEEHTVEFLTADDNKDNK